jgi:hypothetical protein
MTRGEQADIARLVLCGSSRGRCRKLIWNISFICHFVSVSLQLGGIVAVRARTCPGQRGRPEPHRRCVAAVIDTSKSLLAAENGLVSQVGAGQKLSEKQE